MNRMEIGITTDPHASRITAMADVLGVSADYLLGRAESEGPAVVTEQHQAKPTGTKSARHTGRAANGTHTQATPARGTPTASPESSRSPAMCPHCYTPMVLMDDGQGLVCPGCRYQRQGDT